MSQPGQGPAQHTSQVIAVLRSLPPWMRAIKARLETFSYTVVELNSPAYDALNLIHPPAVVILPFSSRMTLESVQQGMLSFMRKYPNSDAYYVGVYSGRLSLNVADLYRTGMNGVFQCPLDDELLINKVCELSPVAQDHKQMSLDQLVRINIVEIENEKKLPYDVFLYLPMNKKTILYLEKDSVLDEKTIKKFHDNKHYNLYIRRSEIGAYQEHSRKVLMSFGDVKLISATEKSKKIASRIGGLMGGFFSDEEYSEDDGKQMVENLKAFVRDLEDSNGEKKDLVDTVSNFAAQRLTSISHSQNVAAYCAYFGMTLGLTEPQTLRLGGLLHDIGMADLPQELVGKDIKSMSADDAAKYRMHPGAGKMAVARKKLEVPKEVLDMIMYHHEHTDGTGYPYGKSGDEIPPYAKVCAFADEFDKLTSIRPGYPQFTPKEAIMRIAGLDGAPPLAIYDPVFHKPLVDLYLKESSDYDAKMKPARAKPVTVIDAGAPVPAVAPAKVPSVSLARLLKTEAFALPEYFPDLVTGDPVIDEAYAELSEQITQLFRTRVAQRSTKPSTPS